MLCLDEILDSNDIVLVDGSVKQRKPGKDFFKNIKGHRFSSPNPELTDLLTTEKENVNQLIKIFKFKKVKTIPQLTDEMRSYKEKLEKYEPFLAGGYWVTSLASIRKINKSIYTKLKRNATKLILASESSELPETRNPENSQYAQLVRMINIISGSIPELKRDLDFIRGDYRRDRSHDSDTDERMIAAAYFCALQGYKCAIVSNDGDFSKLLGVGTRLIGSDEFLQDNQDFRKAIVLNSIDLYSAYTETPEPLMSTREMRFKKTFEIRKIPKQESDEIKRQISICWLNLSRTA